MRESKLLWWCAPWLKVPSGLHFWPRIIGNGMAAKWLVQSGRHR